MTTAVTVTMGATGASGNLNTFVLPARQVYSATCSVAQTSVTLPLGEVSSTDFSGVNSIAGSASTTLDLTCNAPVKLLVMLQGTQNTDLSTNTSVLALTGAGGADVAKGVGVQLKMNNILLKRNVNVQVDSRGAPAGTATYQETLTANYIQTLATIVDGKANTTATLAITYQ